MTRVTPGDFSSLAVDYAKHRPGYNRLVVDLVLSAPERPLKELSVADVGAGTGILTNLMASRGPMAIVGVEPNDSMREQGMIGALPNVEWRAGSAEVTGLPSSSMSLVTMASSFHWADTQVALEEFDRVLQPGGVFAALWNPRITELSEVESRVDELLTEKYDVKTRRSSGRSGITQTLAVTLATCPIFADTAYIEAMDVIDVPAERYLGAWRSVNDIRSQIGEERFPEFIRDVELALGSRSSLDVHYQTRCWIARKP